MQSNELIDVKEEWIFELKTRIDLSDIGNTFSIALSNVKDEWNKVLDLESAKNKPRNG